MSEIKVGWAGRIELKADRSDGYITNCYLVSNPYLLIQVGEVERLAIKAV